MTAIIINFADYQKVQPKRDAFLCQERSEWLRREHAAPQFDDLAMRKVAAMAELARLQEL